MAINKEKVFSTLNDLIETLKDGENGFKTAADFIEESDIKILFIQYSKQRSAYINELNGLIAGHGGETRIKGSISGTLHRGWMNLKSALLSKEAEEILTECEKGEDIAVKDYEDALKQELPADIKSVISEQYGGIKAVHDNVRHLRDYRKKA